MTDRPSDRELLRRVVANDDAMRDGSHIEHLLPHFDERKAIIDAIRARLAEPEAEVSCPDCEAVFRALHPECWACPGVPNSCTLAMCDCFDSDKLDEQVAALRADLAALVPLARAGLNAYDYVLAKEQYGNATVPLLDRVSIDESLSAARAILDRRDREAK